MPTTEPLTTVGALSDRLDDPLLRIADVRWYLNEPDRGREEFDAGHIPGAVFVDLDSHLSARSGPGRHPLPDRATFAATLGALGFGDDHHIVAYDDSGGAVAARLWWMLRWIGHEACSVLDGGLAAWKWAGLDLEMGTSACPPATLSVGESLTRTIDRDRLAGALDDFTIIDARARERFRGDTEPVDAKAGHIPSARNIPYAENLAADGRFLPPTLLSARYRAEAAGRDTVVYCGSGVNACHAALTMTVAGLDEPTLYPGSWSDWSSTDLPIATGDAEPRP
ncbi:MAG: sulfurtransferase [Acidimicrobiia bacterium]